MLKEKYQAEIESILNRYPPEWKRSAVMPLLYLAQREYGELTPEALAEVGALCELSATQVAGVVGFYSLYHLAERRIPDPVTHSPAEPGKDGQHRSGRRRVQICTDLPCALRGADAFAEALCQKLGVKWDETTADGEFTVEHVMCVGACDKAPVFQIQDRSGIHFHESKSAQEPMTVEQALEILNGLKSKEESKS